MEPRFLRRPELSGARHEEVPGRRSCGVGQHLRDIPLKLVRLPLPEVIGILPFEQPAELTEVARSDVFVGDDVDRQTIHSSARQGSTNSTPVCAKSLTLRVAQVAPCARQIAAICASAVLIGAPADSRATSTSA